MRKTEQNRQLQFTFESQKNTCPSLIDKKVVCFQQVVSARNAEAQMQKEREVLAKILTAYKRYKW